MITIYKFLLILVKKRKKNQLEVMNKVVMRTSSFPKITQTCKRFAYKRAHCVSEGMNVPSHQIFEKRGLKPLKITFLASLVKF